MSISDANLVTTQYLDGMDEANYFVLEGYERSVTVGPSF